MKNSYFQASYSDINPAGHFSMKEIQQLGAMPELQATIATLTELGEEVAQLRHYKRAHDTAGTKERWRAELYGAESAISSQLYGCLTTLELIDGIAKHQVLVLNDELLVAPDRLNDGIAKPALEAFHYMRHLGINEAFSERKRPGTVPLYYKKQEYEALPETVTGNLLLVKNFAGPSDLSKEELAAQLIELRIAMEEEQMQGDRNWSMLCDRIDAALEFFNRPEVENILEAKSGRRFSN